jgi:hypothetical protein
MNNTMNNTMSDEKLIAHFQQTGDESCFDTVCQRRTALLRQFFTKYLNPCHYNRIDGLLAVVFAYLRKLTGTTNLSISGWLLQRAEFVAHITEAV